MPIHHIYRWLGLLVLLLALHALSPLAAAQSGVVNAVLFYSPTCPHCHDVIDNDLPPLFQQYGEQLRIVGIDVSLPGGQQLYQAAIATYAIPDDRLGVPTLIIGEHVLVGSGEIPQQLPSLIEGFLLDGGVAFPPIPGLDAVVNPAPAAEAAAPVGPPAAPADQAPAADAEAAVSPFARDPVGNGLAVVVLIGMLAIVGHTLLTFGRTPAASAGASGWLIPLLAVVGLGVSGYLAVVEASNATAVCGPVGHCNEVQQSVYARLFGVPVAVLGVVGYVLMLAAWLVSRLNNNTRLAASAQIALFLLAGIGVLASLVLTFLEPFVIGATCMWCLLSALIMTALLWATRDTSKQGLVLLGLRATPQGVARSHSGRHQRA